MEGDSILKKQKSRNLGRDSDLVDLYNQFRRMWGTSKLFIYEYNLMILTLQQLASIFRKNSRPISGAAEIIYRTLIGKTA
jgi:hypothetical protein